jgi:GR25 family glycosyltransferase involved in LPS biosynthesis
LASVASHNQELATWLVKQADVLKTIHRVFRLNFKSSQILEYYTYLILSLCTARQNLEILAEEMTFQVMSILEFAKMKIKSLCRKKKFYGKAYENFIKITENLINTSAWLIEKRDFKTEFKQTQKWVLLIDLFILLEIRNNKKNILLKEKILFMLTRYIHVSDDETKMEIEAADLVRLFNDFISISPVKKNGQIVKQGWIFFM